jgi:hypothetical protein
MPTMAKPKRKPIKAEDPTMLTRGLRMTGAYSKWLERFAKSQRMPVASLIDRAMASYAGASDFETPPERVP